MPPPICPPASELDAFTNPSQAYRTGTLLKLLYKFIMNANSYRHNPTVTHAIAIPNNYLIVKRS